MQPLDPTDPRRLGVYRLNARLGEGGEGVVYFGYDEHGGRVAVKLFHASVSDGLGALDTFTRELAAAKQVARFCTAQVLDSGTFGDRRYIVSEFVDGPALGEVVAERGPYSGSALERLAIATATALVSLHDAGVLHRDLKPQNVLIAPDGPRVIDFGISRALSGPGTMVSRTVGTPAYMAPEQLQPGELGPAADVFAWASTMVFAATGRPPFGNESIPVVFNRIANGEPSLDGIEEPLRALLADCFAKDPARRPAAQDVLDRLVRPASRGPSPAPPVPAAAPAPPPAPPAPPPPSVRSPSPAGQGSASTDTKPHGPAGGRRAALLAGAGVAVAVAIGAVFAVARLAGGGAPPGDERAVPEGPAGTAAPPSAAAGPAGAGADAGSASPSPGTSRSQAPSSSAAPSSGPSSDPAPQRSATPPSKAPEGRPKLVRVELGPGHFTAYCQTLDWEWVEYRETPTPGAYCVKRKGDVMRLSAAQRDAGCQWRYGDSAARHFFKGKSNYCYAMKPES